MTEFQTRLLQLLYEFGYDIQSSTDENGRPVYGIYDWHGNDQLLNIEDHQ